MTKKDQTEEQIETQAEEVLSPEGDILSEAQSEVVALKDKLMRTAAEMENMRRRYEKQIEDVREYSVSSFAKDLMSVMDNFSRALSHKPDAENDAVKNFIIGVEMTESELMNIFKKHKIEAIKPEVGEKFDYNLHQAISQIPSDEHPEGVILSSMQDGYKFKERLLRPAVVAVSKAVV